MLPMKASSVANLASVSTLPGLKAHISIELDVESARLF